MGDPCHWVDSYKFADVVRLWGRERLVHEVIVARELANGVIRDGLRFQSVNPKWVGSSEPLRRSPYVGYAARDGDRPVIVRSDALAHLLGIVRNAAEPEIRLLGDEFVTRHDFRDWLVHTGRAMPAFWFAPDERHMGDAGEPG
jgi:hypothetical protein